MKEISILLLTFLFFLSFCEGAVITRDAILRAAITSATTEVESLTTKLYQKREELRKISILKNKATEVTGELNIIAKSMRMNGMIRLIGKDITRKFMAKENLLKKEIDQVKTEIIRKQEDVAHKVKYRWDQGKCPSKCLLGEVYKKCRKYAVIEPYKVRKFAADTELPGASRFTSPQDGYNGIKNTAVDAVQCCKLNHTEMIYDKSKGTHIAQGFIVDLADKDAKCYPFGLERSEPEVWAENDIESIVNDMTNHKWNQVIVFNDDSASDIDEDDYGDYSLSDNMIR